MQFEQLQNFLRVAAVGNVTQAARELYLTQPALTRQIKALENELGIALFERTARGMSLTEAGLALCDYARRTLALLEECAAHLQELKAGGIGRLVLGAGVTTSIFHLPPWLRQFHAAFPGVDVTVKTGRSKEVAAMVLDRVADLGFVTSFVEHRELCAVALFQEDIVLVGSGSRRRSAALTVAQFTNTPLILFPKGAGFREYLDLALLKAGLSANIKMESDSLEAIKSFVAVGMGMSFLPIAAVRAELKRHALRQHQVKSLPKLQRRTTLIYRVDRRLSTAARAFLGQVVKRYGVAGR